MICVIYYYAYAIQIRRNVIYVINGYNIRRRYIYLCMCKDNGTSSSWGMARAADGALLKHVDSSLPDSVYRDRGKYIYTHINIERERQTEWEWVHGEYIGTNGCSTIRVLLSHGSYMYVKYNIIYTYALWLW